MERLGLIVIDEEHESTYKQKARRATTRARRRGVDGEAPWRRARLGSATPSIESLCRCKADPRGIAIALPERANGKPSLRSTS